MSPYEIAAAQGGVLTRRQAIGLGLTVRMIDRRVLDGRWTVEASGVYRLLPSTGEADRLRAAVAALPDPVVSHGSAARLLRVDLKLPRVPTVTVHASTTHAFPGVEVRRTRSLIRSDVATVEGMPTTTLARTLVDLAGEVDDARWSTAVDEQIIAGRPSLERLASVARRVCGRGRAGTRLVRSYFTDRMESGVMSELERRGVAVLRAGGLGGFVAEFPLPWDQSRRFDLAFPDAALAVEWDSRRWHSSVERMRADRRRDREAMLHGWMIVRFTMSDLDDPDEVVGTVWRLLARRRTAGQALPQR